MESTQLQVNTGSDLVTDITSDVRKFCSGQGDGLVNVFLPHATAGVALMETGSGSEGDLQQIVDDLLPPEDRYQHSHGSKGHGRDHVFPVFVSPSLVIPVEGGDPQLGTWQSIVVVDTNRDNTSRKVRLSFVSG